MLRSWLRWQCRILGISPTLTFDNDIELRGFGSFSDYWSSDGMIPNETERSFLSRYLKTNGTVWDVGANLGGFSATLSRLMPDSTITSFEPDPRTFSKLRINLARNRIENVSIKMIACGSTSGSTAFLSSSHSPATNRICRHRENTDCRELIEVPITTLDDFAHQNGVTSIQFIKIDVEGFEVEVLNGCSRLFSEQRIDLGLIEVCPGNLTRAERSPKDLLDAAKLACCQLHLLNTDGSIGVQISEEDLKRIELTNAALVPNHRIAHLLNQ